jgi:hypothetical protein
VSPSIPTRSGAAWLTRERILVYGVAVFIVYAGVLALAFWRRIWFVDDAGQGLAVDFVTFWASGFATATGDAAAIYDVARYKAVEVAALGHDFSGLYSWVYPPDLLLLTTPLASLPYLLAWLLWVAACLALMTVALCLIAPWRLAVPLALAAPASLWCAVVGQNGFLTAGLMGFALIALERRPWVAGLCMGVLTYKPQFGLPLPVFLIATRNFRAFFGAVIGAVGLFGLSAVVFGPSAWLAFVRSLSSTSGVLLMGGGADWAKLQSLYAMFHLVTGDAATAMRLHVGLCVAMLAGLIWLWTRPAPLAVKAASLVAGAFLCTPYAYVYDSVLLTVGVAFLARDGVSRGFLPWDKPLLSAAWALPALFGVLESGTAPLAALVILLVAARRAFGDGVAMTHRAIG